MSIDGLRLQLFNEQIRTNLRAGRRIAKPVYGITDLSVVTKSWVATAKNSTKTYYEVAKPGSSELLFHIGISAEFTPPMYGKIGEGNMVVNYSPSQLVDPAQEAWTTQTNAEVIETTRLIDRGLRSSLIDFKKLAVSDELCVKLDIDIVSYSGVDSLIDSVYYAMLSIFRGQILPSTLEVPEQMRTPGAFIKTSCLATTVHVFSQSSEELGYGFLLDASHNEEVAVNCSVLVVSDSQGRIRALQKRGVDSIHSAVLIKAVQVGVTNNLSRLNYV
jgi:exosome complex RNA-binding protein Rrp42 (RNase PH superfamily)